VKSLPYREVKRKLEAAGEIVHKMRQLALDLPFEQVGEIVSLNGEQCNTEARREELKNGDETNEGLCWLLIQAGQHVRCPWNKRISRTVNPTRSALETQLAALEDGRYCSAFASGMAATTAVMNLLSAGDHVVVGDDLYGGTYRLFSRVFSRYGLTFSYVDLGDLAATRAALEPNTKLIWAETPTNPLMTLVDIAALAALAALTIFLRAPAFEANHQAGIEAIAYYWHFVFIVWVALWATIYLIK